MKLLRAIALDSSDLAVYERSCDPGEWAVTGSFVFLGDDPNQLSGKRRQAFRSGFLGTQSFGWSTLVEVAEIDEDDYQLVVDRLAAHLISEYGAPHIVAALPAAAEEVEYASAICEHPAHTLLAIEREFGEGGIVERLRVVRPPSAADHGAVKIWSVDASAQSRS